MRSIQREPWHEPCLGVALMSMRSPQLCERFHHWVWVLVTAAQRAAAGAERPWHRTSQCLWLRFAANLKLLWKIKLIILLICLLLIYHLSPARLLTSAESRDPGASSQPIPALRALPGTLWKLSNYLLSEGINDCYCWFKYCSLSAELAVFTYP